MPQVQSQHYDPIPFVSRTLPRLEALEPKAFRKSRALLDEIDATRARVPPLDSTLAPQRRQLTRGELEVDAYAAAVGQAKSDYEAAKTAADAGRIRRTALAPRLWDVFTGELAAAFAALQERFKAQLTAFMEATSDLPRQVRTTEDAMASPEAAALWAKANEAMRAMHDLWGLCDTLRSGGALPVATRPGEPPGFLPKEYRWRGPQLLFGRDKATSDLRHLRDLIDAGCGPALLSDMDLLALVAEEEAAARRAPSEERTRRPAAFA